jgi:hypothetical protein
MRQHPRNSPESSPSDAAGIHSARALLRLVREDLAASALSTVRTQRSYRDGLPLSRETGSFRARAHAAVVRTTLLNDVWAELVVCRAGRQKTENVGFRFPIIRHYAHGKSLRGRQAQKAQLPQPFRP